MATEPQVQVFGSPQELFRAAAEKFCSLGSSAIQDRGKFTVALSGGSTPRGLHQELVTHFASQLPWDKVFFFWGDERHVPPDSSDSNYRMANETLLSKLPIPPANIFRIPSELPDARQAAAKYEQMLLQFFKLNRFRDLISFCSAWGPTDIPHRCFLEQRPCRKKITLWLVTGLRS